MTVERGWDPAVGRPVDLLVLTPVGDFQIPLPVDFVPHNAPIDGQRRQVLLYVGQRHRSVEWPDIRLDQPNMVLRAAPVVALRPEADPCQARTQWQRRHVVGLEEARLDRADTTHAPSPRRKLKARSNLSRAQNAILLPCSVLRRGDPSFANDWTSRSPVDRS